MRLLVVGEPTRAVLLLGHREQQLLLAAGEVVEQLALPEVPVCAMTSSSVVATGLHR